MPELNDLIFRKMDSREYGEFMKKITDFHAGVLAENYPMSAQEARAEAKRRLDELMSESPEDNVFVTVLEGSGTAGYIWYIYKYDSEKNCRFAYAAYLYINTEKRGMGFGTAALEDMERAAAEKGCAECRLCVWKTNPRARALYQRLGYTDIWEGEKRFLMSKNLTEV